MLLIPKEKGILGREKLSFEGSFPSPPSTWNYWANAVAWCDSWASDPVPEAGRGAKVLEMGMGSSRDSGARSLYLIVWEKENQLRRMRSLMVLRVELI